MTADPSVTPVSCKNIRTELRNLKLSQDANFPGALVDRKNLELEKC